MLCSFCILVMLQIRFLSNLILAKSTFLQKEDTTYCLQPYFVQLPLTTFLLFQKIHLPQKVANRVFTQSLHFAYSAAFIPVQNLLYQLHSVPSFTHCLHILESSHAGIVQAEQEAMQAPSAQSLRASASQ